LMLCPCATPPEVGVPATASSLRFFAWCESPVARATYPRFTRVRPGSCAAEISCTRRCYPLVEPRTTGPVLLHFSNRQRSWDFFHPSQFSFTRGSRCLTPACWDISPRAAFVRPPFIPTCRYPSFISPADFYGCRPANLNSFQVRNRESTDDEMMQTGSWVLLPRASQITAD